MEHWAFDNSEAMKGGTDRIVEIDEDKFRKRKFHRGRIIKETWLLGCIECETKLFFIQPLLNRSNEVLLKIINE